MRCSSPGYAKAVRPSWPIASWTSCCWNPRSPLGSGSDTLPSRWSSWSLSNSTQVGCRPELTAVSRLRYPPVLRPAVSLDEHFTFLDSREPTALRKRSADVITRTVSRHDIGIGTRDHRDDPRAIDRACRRPSALIEVHRQHSLETDNLAD